MKKADNIISEARLYWGAMQQFRRQRERCKRYCYGDQWNDPVFIDGKWMPEAEYIRSQGSEPLKNNLIRRLVKNVMGLYRAQQQEVECMARDPDEQPLAATMTSMLQYNRQLNRADEINARALEEFLISGMVVQRKTFGFRNRRNDCWTDMVHPTNFFIDTAMRDTRGWDVRCVGEIHDMSFEELCAQFATSPEVVQTLRNIYHQSSRQTTTPPFGQQTAATGFYQAADPSLCRVVEVWRREMHQRLLCHDYATATVTIAHADDSRVLPDTVRKQWMMEESWHYYFLTPEGYVLDEGTSPYHHGGHPYVFKAYPFIDGEIHSFVADVIDQQRFTNRLITLYDWVMRASAKGVLLVPEECIPEGYTLDDFADEWSRFNGVIAIRTKPGGELPKQVAANATNIGIKELLQLQLDFFEDISGVGGVLQGKTEYHTSGTLFEQQTRNAALTLLDLLDTFRAFLIDGAYKDVANMQQFYDRRRQVSIAGKVARKVTYDPQKMADVEFDLIITDRASSALYAGGDDPLPSPSP